ncbi:1-(5-phosphoribosyl)-5-((5-phosphoribosylamino)methylideneamino)imidazole-4-carboxamide isomerase [Acidianus sulfidivorans JP7]|uniref:1-(5-phosphoribosyl)-5-((5-phosphoribosylamino)methylideneamino)imidazole-4-carboxamide isomerase n=1 Tax=Acidianus sulfidivorans JP7 TaxID=619593 RepID=A0A2U9INM8_9CREN|nr:1-(5-phosphoribosyl)-5-((5-phosphoribosylamino)methylideneamino)imidazole-4-carboxamide isomerase [Acidianus sulfidivorans JP7]
MKVVPSIDISEGKAVKRIKGVRNSGLILGDPVKIAEEIYNDGYDFVHIVDLDSAEGNGDNEPEISLISKVGFKKIEVGGGIRSYDKASRLFSLGITDIVISTLPFTNIKEFEKILNDFSDRTMISIDYCNDYVLIKGWKEKADSVQNVLHNLSRYSLEGIIFTYVCNEGTKLGIDENIDKYTSLFNGVKGYAGGIGKLDDLLKLKNKGIDFAIVGMSFYSGTLRGVKFV